MRIDEKIINELYRYNQINKYLNEQEAPPPPAEVIVVKPEPDIELLEPVFPCESTPLPIDAPPSPTVTVITVPPFTV